MSDVTADNCCNVLQRTAAHCNAHAVLSSVLFIFISTWDSQGAQSVDVMERVDVFPWEHIEDMWGPSLEILEDRYEALFYYSCLHIEIC